MNQLSMKINIIQRLNSIKYNNLSHSYQSLFLEVMNLLPMGEPSYMDIGPIAPTRFSKFLKSSYIFFKNLGILYILHL